MSNWEDRSDTLEWLRDQAWRATDNNTFGWLKRIGVIPQHVEYRRVVPVKLDLDPNDIKAGYLASCAYEWDSWGKSTPNEFLDAIEAETAGSLQRDYLVNLWALVRGEAGALAA